jgi:hemerythrin-like domain-containing protein
MKAAELMVALEVVEQDHQLVLHKITALKESIESLLDPAGGCWQELLHRLKEINDFLETKFAAHQEQEEKALFPLLELLGPYGTRVVQRLQQEHDAIRGKQKEFAGCLVMAFELQDNFPKAVLRDLVIDAWALWDLLDKHAAAETQAVQQCFTRYLQGQRAPGPEASGAGERLVTN